jgi:hypothetical protein
MEGASNRAIGIDDLWVERLAPQEKEARRHQERPPVAQAEGRSSACSFSRPAQVQGYRNGNDRLDPVVVNPH